MDFFSAFEISAAGMNLERMRLDVSATNLANAHTTRGPDGAMFRPLRLVAQSEVAFPLMLDRLGSGFAVPGDVTIEPLNLPPREVYEPGHPDADERGFVAYPAVNPVTEMIQLIEITRTYEANVRALNAAKSMALRALEIGGER